MRDTTAQPKPSLSRAEATKIMDFLKEKYPVLQKAKTLCDDIQEKIQADNRGNRSWQRG